MSHYHSLQMDEVPLYLYFKVLGYLSISKNLSEHRITLVSVSETGVYFFLRFVIFGESICAVMSVSTQYLFKLFNCLADKEHEHDRIAY